MTPEEDIAEALAETLTEDARSSACRPRLSSNEGPTVNEQGRGCYATAPLANHG
jgi:hypothetical protein